jgi:hypothetical protein
MSAILFTATVAMIELAQVTCGQYWAFAEEPDLTASEGVAVMLWGLS